MLALCIQKNTFRGNMILRAGLKAPQIDLELLGNLVELVSDIDGGNENECLDKVAKFNLLSETNHKFNDFQGIYGSNGHEEWVKGLLRLKSIKPQFNLTKNELLEITKLAVLGNEAYLDILAKNVSYPFVSELIYYPEEVFDFNNEEPTEEEIVDFLLQYRKTVLSRPEQVKLLTKHMKQELSNDEFRVLSENLVGFELNYLSNWLSENDYTPYEAIQLIYSGKLVADYAATISLKT
ncbi:hypothetical protein [Aliivibrio fischeri]|uniref:hypothetical protein n=2 Tax=Aliivibrio fischeri TaxID=668 RepID=UPI001290776F|nr:hypothetical protein [Aliivibrio fischeri]MBP3140253.1 hypothetical protein [Aliivibrio fischeri]MUK43595.1 hypothetical protein [Aliivibrio fischeri]